MNRWMRSRTDRKIAGVCGGIAQVNGWDSTVVRLVWVALVVFGGTGVLAYLILWGGDAGSAAGAGAGCLSAAGLHGIAAVLSEYTVGPREPELPGSGPRHGAREHAGRSRCCGRNGGNAGRYLTAICVRRL